MSSRFLVVEASLNRAEFRWKWLQFLQYSGILGTLLCLAASKEEKELGKSAFDGEILSTPVAANGSPFILSDRLAIGNLSSRKPESRSISPTDRCDETSRLNMARRFGSAMISKTDSIPLIYPTAHIPVKVYTKTNLSQLATRLVAWRLALF